MESIISQSDLKLFKSNTPAFEYLDNDILSNLQNSTNRDRPHTFFIKVLPDSDHNAFDNLKNNFMPAISSIILMKGPTSILIDN